MCSSDPCPAAGFSAGGFSQHCGVVIPPLASLCSHAPRSLETGTLEATKQGGLEEETTLGVQGTGSSNVEEQSQGKECGKVRGTVA